MYSVIIEKNDVTQVKSFSTITDARALFAWNVYLGTSQAIGVTEVSLLNKKDKRINHWLREDLR